MKRFNENFIKRGLNKIVGKPLSIGDRITDTESSSNEGYPHLKTAYLKRFINYLEGKMDDKPYPDGIKSYLIKIQGDLKSIIDNKSSVSHWDGYKEKYPLIKQLYSAISLTLKVSIPSYKDQTIVKGIKKIGDSVKPWEKQYNDIINIVKDIYKISYNEGN